MQSNFSSTYYILNSYDDFGTSHRSMMNFFRISLVFKLKYSLGKFGDNVWKHELQEKKKLFCYFFL